MNVDSLKLIQVGVTLCDADGNFPPDVATWQFNLKFDMNTDQYSPESISLLMNCGIDFEVMAHRGIPFEKFGEYFMISGLMLNEEIHWVSFHGVYDFAYLMKVITGLPLPETENSFFENVRLYFPHYYDIRYLVRYTENFRGSLSKLGQELNINRIGIQHQAGSDSIITSEIFFKLKSDFFSDDIIRADKNVLFGIGGDDYESSFNNLGFFNGNSNTYPQKVNIPQVNPGSSIYPPEYTNPYFPQNVNMMNMPYSYGARTNNPPPYYPNKINVGVNPYGMQYPQMMNSGMYSNPIVGMGPIGPGVVKKKENN
jgi:CCR4-NOT transcription complex subunit 7/8